MDFSSKYSSFVGNCLIFDLNCTAWETQDYVSLQCQATNNQSYSNNVKTLLKLLTYSDFPRHLKVNRDTLAMIDDSHLFIHKNKSTPQFGPLWAGRMGKFHLLL